MERIDVLSREGFVEQLMQLTENISNSKNSVSFAINGKWGCGKSFVLDMFEERLSLEQNPKTKTDKYFIVRYNCWKYDYYDEPLVAIVASMLETIEQKTKLLKEEDRAKLNGVLRAIGTTLLSLTSGAIKEKTGIDIKEAFGIVKEGITSGSEAFEKMHDYDVYFSFNKALASLQNVLSELGKEYTVVFLIDELDRCVPEYSIKVLERLHHLTENTKGIISVISIDKTQLQKSITQIFGFESPDEYLKKFIQFTVHLNIGTISEEITNKYADYINLFDKDLFVFDESIDEFLQELFKNIDVRTQEQLVSKAHMVHKLLFNDKKDYSFMCMELLLTVLICVHNVNACFEKFSRNFQFNTVFNSSKLNLDIPITRFFAKKFESIPCGKVFDGSSKEGYQLPKIPLLYGAILYSWYHMNEGWKDIRIDIPSGEAYEPIKDNYKELNKFAETLKFIRQ